jgi:Xaa-Pro aminopeptidase
MNTLVQQKIAQAVGLLGEHDIDLWLAQFARETGLHPEPSQDLVVGTTVTWPSAFLIARDGQTIAVVGTGDAEEVRRGGGYAEVVPYVQGIREPLLAILDRLQPRHIALNYSTSDHTADGITHGMFLLLRETLDGTPYADRLTSAGPILAALRARKLPVEVDRIRAAVDRTEALFDRLQSFLRPGVSERQAHAFLRGELRAEGLAPAWDPAHCPHVAIGPETPIGHVGPSDITAQPGHLIFVDLGVCIDGYCSDLQRTYYLLRQGESSPPPAVQAAFDAVWRALGAGAAALQPGVAHWQVDRAARDVLIAAGYPEPQFAFGHHLGRAAHDGGGTLGPRWERYGETPGFPVEAGNVFALEFAVPCAEPGHGWVSLEENVAVGEDGALAWLSRRQSELRLIPAPVPGR